MNPVFLHAWREARCFPLRHLLALAGVTLGVAAFVALQAASGDAQQAYRRLYAALAGGADLEVTAEGAGSVDAGLAAAVAATPGVRVALPVLQGAAALVAPGPRTTLHVLGVLPGADAALREPALVEGRPLGEQDALLLPAAFARERGLSPGARVSLVTASGRVELPVAGLLAPTRLTSAGAVPGLMPLATAQRLFGRPGAASAIQVALVPGADPEAVAERLRASLPVGLTVSRPWARGALAEGTLAAADAGLSAVSLMALVAAVFVAGNAFALGLVARRRALAELRALGATRGQVARGLVAEALTLGLVGAALGLALGLPAAQGVSVGLERLLGTTLPPLEVGALPVVLALLLGPLSTLAAAIGPVRRAQRRDVLLDLQGLPDLGRSEPRRLGPWVGLALLAASGVVGVGLASGWAPQALVAPGVAAAMLGAALSFPWLLPGLERLLVAVGGRWAGPAGWLGLAQVARRPGSATLTATVVFVAVMGGVGMGGRLVAAVEDVHGWSERALHEDFFVRAAMPEAGTMQAAPVPRELAGRVAGLPGVRHVNRIRFLPARSGGERLLVLARTFEPGRPLGVPVREALRPGPLLALADDEILLGSVLARRLHKRPGDPVELATPTGPRAFRVAAIVTEYTLGGHAAYLSWSAAEAALGEGPPHALMVAAVPGGEDALGGALRRLCDEEGLLLQSTADLRAAVDGMVGGLMGLLWVALVLVFAVAAVGVTNTLATSVVDQTRTLGLLRAVGMTRAQVRRSVTVQAVALGLLGAVPGALAGAALGALLQRVIAAVHGHELPAGTDPLLLGGSVAAATLLAVAAAWGPARRAARLPVPLALRHD